jgi:hypothetical protein
VFAIVSLDFMVQDANIKQLFFKSFIESKEIMKINKQKTIRLYDKK